MDDDEQDIEQFSDESRRALATATDRLIEGLRSYTTTAIGMHGGSAELAELFDRNDVIEALVSSWTDVVGDHTGTVPILLGENEYDEEDEEDEPPQGSVISVVSRFDLTVVAEDELLAAGRAAHRRNQPEENDEDTLVAVPTPAHALYEITHEAGEPWFDIPGIEGVRGARAYLVPDEPPGPLSDDPEDLLDDIAIPAGEVVRGESWVVG